MPVKLSAALLGLALFTVTFAVNLQAPLYSAYAAESDVGATAVTIAFAAYVAGLMPTLIVLGGLSDRIGRRAPIIAALWLAAVATGLLIVWPDWTTLIIARALLGVGTGLATTTGTAWMTELLGASHAKRAAIAVTSTTSLGFGGGALATGISLGLQGPTLFPASFVLLLLLAPGIAVATFFLPQTHPQTSAPLLRIPIFPAGGWIFGIALALAWSVTGITIAVVPLALARNGWGGWSGLVIFLAIFTGFLNQPIARRLSNETALAIGFALIPTGLMVLMAGIHFGILALVLTGTCLCSAASYGFTYLAALAEMSERAPDDRARATAGLFLYAYAGFSLPVIASGAFADIWGLLPAMTAFSAAAIMATVIVVVIWTRQGTTARRRSADAGQTARSRT